MKFILCLLLWTTFFPSASFTQPYLSETRSQSKFEYTLQEDNSIESRALKSFKEELTGNQFIDMELRVYPTALDPNSSLLLYLKNSAHVAHLSIIDMLGNVVAVPLEGVLAKGFYEVSVLSNPKAKGVFIARLVVDGKVQHKHIIR